MEWNPELLRLRSLLEQGFERELRSAVDGGDDLAGVLDALLVEPVDGAG